KGFDLLVEAAAKSTETRMLRLVGDGPETEALKELAAELGVSDRFEFMGRRPSSEVKEVMARAGVVAIPSRREAFGIVALEAWASGTPLVATSTGGPAGFVTDGVDGVLVDPRDTAAFAGAIDSILSNPERARSLAEHGLVSVQRFTWLRVAAQYEEIYNGLPA